MAIVFIQDIDGSSQDVYEQVQAHVGMQDDPPAGLIVHTAGPTDDGWRIVDIWESVEAMIQFRDERLIPAIAASVGELPSEPRVQVTPAPILFKP